MTEREIRQVREQWDKAHSRWSAACDAIAVMRKVADELSAECERLAEIIAEHDDTKITTTDAAHKKLRVRFRSQDLKRLDVTTKQALLRDMNALLGIKSLRTGKKLNRGQSTNTKHFRR